MYLAKHKVFFLRETRRQANWLYTPATKKWSKAAPFPGKKVSGDSVSCYDAKRGLLYIAGGGAKGSDGFYAYDAAEDKWFTLPSIPNGYRFTGNSGHMTYDRANDLLVANIAAAKKLLFYSLEKNKWLAEQAVEAKARGAAFYDPKHNVHYYFSAGDSRDKGVMWVYRHKRAQ